MNAWFAVYRVAARALVPLAQRRLAHGPGGPDRSGERRGDVPESGGELWIHAASVGEVQAASGLVERLLDADPALRIVVSTMTPTGARRVQDRLGSRERVRHLFAPLDYRAAVARWLDRTAPRALLLVETELWPEMLHACRARDLPVAVVNARISERAGRRYRLAAPLLRPMLAGLDRVLCQSREDADRFVALGVPSERIAVTGNLKFDRDESSIPGPADAPEWAPSGSRPCWVAGSTRAGDEPVLAGAQAQLVSAGSNALLVAVPRHPERAGEAASTFRAAGLRVGMIDDGGDDIDVLVVDRIGVLEGLYAIASACYVGGTLEPAVGGHNLLEPAFAGKPVVAGPCVANQAEAARALRRHDALVTVETAGALARTLTEWLDDPDAAGAAGRRAREAARSLAGATDATMRKLSGWRGLAGGRSATS